MLVWAVMMRGPREDVARRAATLVGLAVVVIGLDQLTKLLVAKELVLGQSIPVIPKVFHLTLVHNTGMAFGLLSGADLPFKSLFVTLVSVLALGAVLYYALSSAPAERVTRFGLALILGGALGNIIDRIRLGYVIDFLDVFYRTAHWPAFNLADSAICVGVGLLILESLRHQSPAMTTEGDVPVEARRGGS